MNRWSKLFKNMLISVHIDVASHLSVSKNRRSIKCSSAASAIIAAWMRASAVKLARNVLANLAGSVPARVAWTSMQNRQTASKNSTQRWRGTAVELKRCLAYFIFLMREFLIGHVLRALTWDANRSCRAGECCTNLEGEPMFMTSMLNTHQRYGSDFQESMMRPTACVGSRP